MDDEDRDDDDEDENYVDNEDRDDDVEDENDDDEDADDTDDAGEAGLAQILLDDGRIQLSHYGHLVAYGLNKVAMVMMVMMIMMMLMMTCQEKTNWVTYNLAGLYWRMKGDAFESIECLRSSLSSS